MILCELLHEFDSFSSLSLALRQCQPQKPGEHSALRMSRIGDSKISNKNLAALIPESSGSWEHSNVDGIVQLIGRGWVKLKGTGRSRSKLDHQGVVTIKVLPSPQASRSFLRRP